MKELSEIQAKTHSKQEQLPKLSHYAVLRMLLNGDYLVRDKLGDKYLLRHTASKHPPYLPPYSTLPGNLVLSAETIQEESSCF